MYIHELNMSSSSSESEQSSNSVRQGLLTDSGDEDVLVVNLVVNPCESEPLVNAWSEQNLVSVVKEAYDNSVCKNVPFTVNSIFFVVHPL